MSGDWTWVAGVLMIAAAVGWRQAHRRGIRARIAAILQDPDPARRQAAVRVATEQGLRTYSRLLVARTAVETDAGVRAVLVDAVLRTAWEPADRPAIVDLRLWAHGEHARSPAEPALRTTSLPAVVTVAEVRARALPAPVRARHRAVRRTRRPLDAEVRR